MVGAGTDRPKRKIAGGPAIVLVRPQLAVNIGMCARAIATVTRMGAQMFGSS